MTVTTYDTASPISITRPTPYTLNAVDTLVFDVELDRQSFGEPGNLGVVINGNPNFTESVPFTWDGGSNHIELRGSRRQTNSDSVKVVVDRMVVRPR